MFVEKKIVTNFMKIMLKCNTFSINVKTKKNYWHSTSVYPPVSECLPYISLSDVKDKCLGISDIFFGYRKMAENRDYLSKYNTFNVLKHTLRIILVHII